MTDITIEQALEAVEGTRDAQPITLEEALAVLGASE